MTGFSFLGEPSL